MQIQWYPGHMAKARRMLTENLKLIDVVVELTDARAPLASRNPDFDELFVGKARIILLNKSDLADPGLNRAWTNYYRAQGLNCAELNASNNAARSKVVPLIEKAAAERVSRSLERGVNRIVRALIVGIPNVGKSTLINHIAGENRAKTGDKPGVTKGKQWVKVTPYLELLDTPGLLWPKIENAEFAKHLAFLGSINDEILDAEELAGELLLCLSKLCPDKLTERYKKLNTDAPKEALLEQVAQSRGFLLQGGATDTERAARIVLDEFRAGKIAHVTLETPEKP